MTIDKGKILGTGEHLQNTRLFGQGADRGLAITPEMLRNELSGNL